MVVFDYVAIQKECTFFYDKVKVEPKIATIKLVKVTPGSKLEPVLADCEIDLCMHFGKQFGTGEVFL